MEYRLRGLIAAPFTPMLADGRINPAMIASQAQTLYRQGVQGAFICGTTGESLSLSVAERKIIAARWREEVGNELRLIVHVGHTSLPEARELAAHAEVIGADAIGAMAPCFLKPACLDDLVDFCAELAAAAPQTPFFFYHMPAVSGVNFRMESFLRVAGERIPTLAGIKFTHEDIMDYSRCLAADDGRFTILFGRDEMLLSALAVGAPGAVGSTYNFAAPIYQRVIRAFHAGDLATAQREQAHATDLVAVMQQFGGLSAGKSIMKLIGVDCGPTRLPLRSLTIEQEEALRHALERIDFFRLCAV